MKLLFFTEARLIRTADRKFHCRDQSFSHPMFMRYLKIFDRVLVVARSSVGGFAEVRENTIVDNEGVKVLPLPYYIGPYQYLIKIKKIQKVIKNYIDANSDAAVICRVPGVIGTSASKYLIKINRKYGVEVVGDPMDVFAPGSFNHPLRILFRHNGIKNLYAAINGAAASIYVTKKALQLRYPPSKKSFSTFASDVVLPPEAFSMIPKKLLIEPPYTMLAVGTLDAMYKSPDLIIEAMVLLKKKGLCVTLQWLGDGRYKSEMIEFAKHSGVVEEINFVGNVVSANEVRSYMDSADLFLLPSRTEGLPRALLEAMARGLPCIGSKIGGIPELLDSTALVPVNNPKLLAEKILSFLTIPGLADVQAARNLRESHNYKIELLDARRTKFYQYLKEVS